MQSLQSYGKEPVYDGNAYTYSSTYHDGTLRLYAHHPTAPTTSGGRLEYYMTRVKGFDMLSDGIPAQRVSSTLEMQEIWRGATASSLSRVRMQGRVFLMTCQSTNQRQQQTPSGAETPVLTNLWTVTSIQHQETSRLRVSLHAAMLTRALLFLTLFTPRTKNTIRSPCLSASWNRAQASRQALARQASLISREIGALTAPQQSFNCPRSRIWPRRRRAAVHWDDQQRVMRMDLAAGKAESRSKNWYSRGCFDIVVIGSHGSTIFYSLPVCLHQPHRELLDPPRIPPAHTGIKRGRSWCPGR